MRVVEGEEENEDKFEEDGWREKGRVKRGEGEEREKNKKIWYLPWTRPEFLPFFYSSNDNRIF